MCCRNTIFPNHYTPRGARTQFSLELGREARSPPQPASSRGLGNVQFVWLFLSTGTRKLIIGGTRGEPEPAIGMGFPERKPFPWGGRRCLARRTGAGSPASASRAAPGSQHCDARGRHRAQWFGMAGAPMSRYVTAHHVSPCQDASHCHTACQDVSHCVISHHAISHHHAKTHLAVSHHVMPWRDSTTVLIPVPPPAVSGGGAALCWSHLLVRL